MIVALSIAAKVAAESDGEAVSQPEDAQEGLAPEEEVEEVEPPPGVEVPEEAPVFRVRFESAGRLQMEVWLDGEPLGRTPLRTELPAGQYFLTASADAIIPVLQPFEVGDGGDQMVILPTRPVTTENYLSVSQDVFRSLVHFPENPHLLLIALYLTVDEEEAGRLLERADEKLEQNAALEALRARYHLRGGRFGDALRAAERAIGIDGTYALAWRVRAEILAEQEEWERALSAANYAVVQEPYGWRNLRTRARIHTERGNERAARLDTERADELYEQLHRLQVREP